MLKKLYERQPQLALSLLGMIAYLTYLAQDVLNRYLNETHWDLGNYVLQFWVSVSLFTVRIVMTLLIALTAYGLGHQAYIHTLGKRRFQKQQ